MSVVAGGSKCNLITGYSEEEDDHVNYGKARWLAQTFTLDDLYVIFRCRFKSWTICAGSFNHYAIRNTDASGKPVGEDIYHTTLSPIGEFSYFPGKWRRFDFIDFPNLPAGTYALIARVPDARSWQCYKLRCDATAPSYTDGKAWLSHNDGVDWEEIPDTDFMFEIWGWQPPPVGKPTPAISNWAPLNETQEETPDGFIIRVTTDIPIHLFMRWTNIEPVKHAETLIRRGISLPYATRFCFVAWEENEQLEPGDTYIHTFLKPNWAICETRWFYFIGTKQAEESPSASAIFKKHRKEPPEDTLMKTFTSIEPQLFRAPASNAWQTIDASHWVHPLATGLIIHINHRDPGTENACGLQPHGGSGFNASTMLRNTQTWALVGLDSEKKFDAYSEKAPWMDFWVMGYTNRNVVWLTEPLDCMPPVLDIWHTLDFSITHPNAIAALFSIGPVADREVKYGLRKYGSTDDRVEQAFHNWAIIGLDPMGRCEVRFNSVPAQPGHCHLIGYFQAGIQTHAIGVPIPDPPLDIWTERSVKSLSAQPTLSVIEYESVVSTALGGIKKANSLRDLTPWPSRKSWGFIHPDEAGKADFYRADIRQHFYLIGEVD